MQPKEGETKSEALNRANSKAVVPLTIVLRSVTTADEYNKFEAPGIKEYIAKAKDLIIKRKNNVLFNIVVEQDGAYTRIPRFGGIELHVEGEPSKLKLKEDDEVTPTSNTNKLF